MASRTGQMLPPALRRYRRTRSLTRAISAFLSVRSRLFGIAYPHTQALPPEAEDIVQDVWLGSQSKN